MVRNGDSWNFSEPELNDRGEPVIHDIASKLNCIELCPNSTSSDLEKEKDFADLEADMQTATQAQQVDANAKHKESPSYAQSDNTAGESSTENNDYFGDQTLGSELNYQPSSSCQVQSVIDGSHFQPGSTEDANHYAMTQ
jgi:hypothetical protein